MRMEKKDLISVHGIFCILDLAIVYLAVLQIKLIH